MHNVFSIYKYAENKICKLYILNMGILDCFKFKKMKSSFTFFLFAYSLITELKSFLRTWITVRPVTVSSGIRQFICVLIFLNDEKILFGETTLIGKDNAIVKSTNILWKYYLIIFQ